SRLVAVGRKAESYFRFRRSPLEHAFRQMTDRPTYEDARRVAAAIVPAFQAGEVDMVQVVSWRFLSAGTQVIETRQVLPILPAASATPGGHGSVNPADPAGLGGGDGADLLAAVPQGRQGFFEFEPAAPDLLEVLVPRYAEAVVYGALLEASASEHTARQRAMSAATENAEELIKTLRRIMNRARQDSITTEIMEIVGGAEALRGARRRDSGPVDRDDMQGPEEQIA
ncbi:MAG TPA: FoF1 ATP synthase subunit gamma, partial [Acidimicrobiales bacterium]|nr:FoF1 ATP synthase subunit gamma [Acidimicrobiales bacterium]